MFCTQCGSENLADARFCQKCGHPISASAPQSVTPSLSPSTGQISVMWNPNSSVHKIYVAILGEKNGIYYLRKFQQFDQKGLGLNASWNWPALFCSGVWALYRKMYVWFFAFWGVAILSNISAKAGSPWLGAIIFIGPWLTFTIYANSLYHNRVKKKIAVAQLSVKDESKLLELPHHKGGVHTWVIWVFSIILVMGILAAIAIPAYQGYSVRTKTTEVQKSPPTQGQLLLKPSQVVGPSDFKKGTIEYNYAEARIAGVTDDEIVQYLSVHYSKQFDFSGALGAGYLPKQIVDYLLHQQNTNTQRPQ